MMFRKANTLTPHQHIDNVGFMQSSYSSVSSSKIQIGRESSFKKTITPTSAASMTIRQAHTFTSRGADSPVFAKEGKIKMKTSKMETGKFYPVDYAGKKYLIRKTSDGVIDVFRVVK